MTTKTLVKVNNVPIQVIEDKAQIMVPIRPICDALGIDEESQRKKLREDDFLNSVAVLSTATGGDGKQYEMLCLPHEFIFGWLFTINPKNVKEEAREAVAKYRIECYRALYMNFFGNMKQQIESNKIEIDLLEQLAKYNEDKAVLAENIKKTQKQIAQIRDERLKNEPALF